MAPNGSELDPRQELLALGLARGLTVLKAATKAGIAESTAHLWRKEPGFAEHVRSLQAELFAQAVAILAGANARAAGRLAKLVGSKIERISLAASRSVLELGRSLRQDEELEHRVAELEKLMGKRRRS
jgi:hypothetical protein